MPDEDFGSYIRRRREALRESDPRFSVRQVAARIGVEPSYLSKVERGAEPPPSEARIRAIAADLDEDADVLLAMAGKISADLQAIILRRPALMAEIIREMKRLPAHAVLRLVREVREGNW